MTTSTVSLFDTSQICMRCHDAEVDHPDYERARKAEAEAVRGGDFNFQGIGVPPELIP